MLLHTKTYGPVMQINLTVTPFADKSIDTSCYYIDGLLIDTGAAIRKQEFESFFDAYTINLLINTHSHEDHFGNNKWVIEHKNCGPALVHEKAIPIICQHEKIESKISATRIDIWGKPEPSNAEIISSEIKTKNHHFQVIETPGHTDDHICLFEANEGWLFSGDLFIYEKIAAILNSEDANAILSSLHKVYVLDFSKLFCGTGLVAIKNAKKHIEAKINYLENLKYQTIKMYKQGLPEEIIRDQLLGQEGITYYHSEGEHGRINLVRSFIEGQNQNN